MDLIKDVEGASKEQLTGINQINNAVNELDKQTQQNASVASETRQVALSTQTIANVVVKNANDKNFTGKDSVKAKVINSQQHITTSKTEVKKTESKKIEQKSSQIEYKKTTAPKVITSSVKDDEWESF